MPVSGLYVPTVAMGDIPVNYYIPNAQDNSISQGDDSHASSIKRGEQQNHHQLFVLTQTGTTLVFPLYVNQTVKQLKGSIRNKQSYFLESENNIRIIFAGKQLQDHNTLAHYNVVNGSTVHLVPELCGGSSFGMMPVRLFADISDMSGFSNQQMTNGSVMLKNQGRFIADGINIEVFCKCTPQHRVISRQGYGSFELQQAETLCPNCGDKDVIPVTVGFFNCKFRFNGVHQGYISYTLKEWATTMPSFYQVFDIPKQALWSYLRIESKSLVDRVTEPRGVLNIEDYANYKERCTICLETMYINDIITTLPSCLRQFHSSCLSQWKTITCSICRADRNNQ
ncbi:hypothetical protein BDA99DRAFT_537410 [Phascolomyces articulosus]|uniref:Uncharacterized protein n=1 Tax=Phascolomyces articulosus TaxID=60185 RepID=A0AAD5KA37_9FUNG|nr:hypothetical protein BDA99DRAFT_537410 [Phascolomyces articulosus]